MTTPLARLLETLRLALHLVFAALLVVSLVQFLASDATDASPARRVAVIILTALLAVVYLSGTVAGQTTHGLRRFALPWLAVVLGLWLVLVVLSADAVWLLFPLVFVVLSLTGSVAGALAVVGCWVVAAGVPLITGQRSGVGGVLGPAIGVLFAGLAYWTYLRLTREVEHHRQVAEQLVATRDRLLAAENQAGCLAERERLSREIHDTLAQGFNSVLLLSRAARTAIDQGRTGDATDQLSVITATAHDNLIQTRVLVAEGAEG
ncbi:histidine kinase dimerization/phosphoacceptor domain-containing protein, partial [Corynebacterium variabile]